MKYNLIHKVRVLGIETGVNILVLLLHRLGTFATHMQDRQRIDKRLLVRLIRQGFALILAFDVAIVDLSLLGLLGGLLGVDLGEQGYTPSYKPRDQTGQIFGLGIDVQLNDGAFLFLRHSRFSFKDKNFIETNIKGSETTIELKINF